MGPWIALVVLTMVCVGAVQVFAGRQLAAGHRRYAWVFYAPTFLIMALPIGIAFRIWRDSPPTAILVGLVGLTSSVLLARHVRQMASDPEVPAPIGELSPQHFDYIIWTSIGLPFVLIVVILVAVVASALGSSR